MNLYVHIDCSRWGYILHRVSESAYLASASFFVVLATLIVAHDDVALLLAAA